MWINNFNPLEIYIFSEPLLQLYNEPLVLRHKSMFNDKYTYKQMITSMMKETSNDQLENQVWVKLCRTTSILLLSMVQRFLKTYTNTTQLLEFQYLLEEGTFDPWLFNIN